MITAFIIIVGLVIFEAVSSVDNAIVNAHVLKTIGILGVFIILKSFGVPIPEYLPTFITILLVGFSFFKSHQFLKQNAH